MIDRTDESKGIAYFDSTGAFLDWLTSRPQNKEGILGKQASSTNTTERGGWNGTSSFEEALHKAINGDPEVAKSIMPRSINLVDSGSLFTLSHDVAGGCVDIPRALAGDPECMISRVRRGKPIVRILVNASALADIEPGTIIAKGKAVLEIMSGLEQLGYGVDILWSLITEEEVRLTVKLKSSGEYFDLAKLSYWLACPSAQRRLGFGYRERLSKKLQARLGGGYGRSTNIPQEELTGDPDLIYFPKLRGNSILEFRKIIDRTLAKYTA